MSERHSTPHAGTIAGANGAESGPDTVSDHAPHPGPDSEADSGTDTVAVSSTQGVASREGGQAKRGRARARPYLRRFWQVNILEDLLVNIFVPARHFSSPSRCPASLRYFAAPFCHPGGLLHFYDATSERASLPPPFLCGMVVSSNHISL